MAKADWIGSPMQLITNDQMSISKDFFRILPYNVEWLRNYRSNLLINESAELGPSYTLKVLVLGKRNIVSPANQIGQSPDIQK